MASVAAVAKLLAVMCLLVAVRGELSCEPEHFQYGNRCLRVVSDPRTYFSAALECLSAGGSSLVSLSDQGFTEFVNAHAEKLSSSRFWVGMKVKDGILQWADGINVLETPWVTASNVSEQQPFCVASNGKEAIPSFCYQRLPYMCEKLLGTQWSTHRSCNLSSLHFIETLSGSCIFYEFADGVSSLDAVCAEKEADFIDLDAFLKERGLMAHRDSSFPHRFGYWTKLMWNGTHVLWGSGAIDDNELPILFIKGIGSCIAVTFHRDLVLHQVECDGNRAVFCRSRSSLTAAPAPMIIREAALSCPDGYNWKEDRTTGYCYWETSFETERLSWSEAQAFCKSYGGNLASFHSKEEEKMGLSFQYGSLAHDYWIGLKLDENTNGRSIL